MRQKVLTLCFCISVCYLSAQGQGKEAYASPRVLNHSPGKGLLLNYQKFGDYKYRGPGSTSRVTESDQLEVKLRIPVLLKARTKVLLGLQYFQETYEFEEDDLLESDFIFQRLNQTPLKRSRLTLSVGHSLNSKFYTAFRLEAAYSGDYSGIINFDDRYATYKGTAALGYKKSARLEYGLGLYYSNSFRRNQILPFAFYNQTFSDKFGLEFLIPVKLKARYNISDRSLLLFGPEYKSQSYSLDVPDEQDNLSIAHIRRQAIEFSATYMYNTGGWTWMEFSAGYLSNFNTRVEDPTLGTAFGIQPADGPFIKLGFFLSPTRR